MKTTQERKTKAPIFKQDANVMRCGNITIERGRVYHIFYECPDCDEDGNLTAYWTGEVDTWGKMTIQPVNSPQPHYLFPREIKTAEPV